MNFLISSLVAILKAYYAKEPCPLNKIHYNCEIEYSRILEITKWLKMNGFLELVPIDRRGINMKLTLKGRELHDLLCNTLLKSDLPAIGQ